MSSWIGDGDEDAADVFETAGRRWQILQTLSMELLSKTELVRTFSVSRSTIGHDVERLVGLSLVERSNDRFAATSTGRVVLETYDEAIRAIASVLGTVPVLDRPLESVELPPSLFREAVVCTGDLPETERRASFDFDINEVTELAGFNGPFLFSSRPEAHEQFTRLSDSIMLVLSAEPFDWLLNRYPDDLDAMVDAGVRVAAVDKDLTSDAVVIDRPTTASITLVVYNHMGVPETLIVSCEPSTAAWGRRLAVARVETARPYRPDE